MSPNIDASQPSPSGPHDLHLSPDSRSRWLAPLSQAPGMDSIPVALEYYLPLEKHTQCFDLKRKTNQGI